MKQLIEQVMGEGWKQNVAAGAMALGLATGAAQPGQAKSYVSHHPTHTNSQTLQKKLINNGLKIVAKVIAGEGASEGELGMTAIACVIQNRGGNPVNVVTRPKQFSAYDDKALMNRNYSSVHDVADRIASKIGRLQDITGGANHYVTKDFYNKKRSSPNFWTNKMQVTKVIGNHVFLRGR